MATPASHVCPYCGAGVRAERAADAPAVCPRCGGVRVAVGGAPRESDGDTIDAADDATAIRTSANVWNAIAIVGACFAVFSALVVWLVVDVADPPLAAKLVAFGGTLAPLAFAAYAWTRGRALSATLPAAVDRAWQSAVLELASEGHPLDAESVAAATHVTAGEAQRFLAALERGGRLVESKQAGKLRYALPSALDVAAPTAD